MSRSYSTVRDRARGAFYSAVLGGTVCIFGGLAYLLTKELILPGGGYKLIDETVDRLSVDQRVISLVGYPPFNVYGVGEGRRGGRRRPLIREATLEDGRACVDAVFFIEGESGRAQVTLQSVEQEDGSWKERYLALDMAGMPTQVLTRPVSLTPPSRWNPFSRFFS